MNFNKYSIRVWSKKEHENFFELLKAQSALEDADPKQKLKGTKLWKLMSEQMEDHGYTMNPKSCRISYASTKKLLSGPVGKWALSKWVVNKDEDAEAEASSLHQKRPHTPHDVDSSLGEFVNDSIPAGQVTEKRRRSLPKVDTGGNRSSKRNPVSRFNAKSHASK